MPDIKSILSIINALEKLSNNEDVWDTYQQLGKVLEVIIKISPKFTENPDKLHEFLKKLFEFRVEITEKQVGMPPYRKKAKRIKFDC